MNLLANYTLVQDTFVASDILGGSYYTKARSSVSGHFGLNELFL